MQAEGTPDPEILWYKEDRSVQVTNTVGVFNDGTELRISSIRSRDLGDYSCVARNGEGTIQHIVKVVIAGVYILLFSSLFLLVCTLCHLLLFLSLLLMCTTLIL